MQALSRAPTVVARLHLSEPRVAAVAGEADGRPQELSWGDLLISEDSVTWWCEAEGRGFELGYRSLALHAVSRDGSVAGGAPCVYCQVYRGDPNADDDGAETDELRLFPEDPAALDGIFKALSECQALHPDDDDDSEGEGDYDDDDGGHDDDEMFADADEDAADGLDLPAEGNGGPGDDGSAVAMGGVELTPEGMATLERLSNLLVVEGDGDGVQQNPAEDSAFQDAD